MSPRGYYSKESIHPHFTTEAYRNSDAYKQEEAYVANLLFKWTLFKLYIRQWFRI